MKKKFILLPLLMLVLASCGPRGDSTSDPSGSEPSGDSTSDTSGDPSGDTSSDPSSDPSSDTSSGGEEDKQEINPAELNAAAGFDVYSLLPKIYSNDYEVFDESSDDYPVDIYVDLFDWELADAEAYELALSTSLQLDEANGYVIQDNLYVFIYLDDELYAPDEVFGLNIYSMAEASEKEEINPAELNAAAGFDVYSLLPKIYSNDYEVFDESSDDYPVDVYVYLWDWVSSDAVAYDAELEASLDFDSEYGYIIEDDLYVFANYNSTYGLGYINIYSVGGGSVEPEVSDVWPAQAINDFFGSSEIGGLVPSFDSDADFSYYVSGEGEEAQLIVYTDYATIDAEDTYIAALEAALWVIDDSLYDYFGYVANDPEEQISLIFYWYDGVMYWSFMTFYHEEESVGVSVIIDDAIPEGWTYISNNPQQYPNPSFYSSGSLKMNYAGIGIESPVFDDTYHTVTISGVLNANQKTSGNPTAIDLVVDGVTVDTWIADTTPFEGIELTFDEGFTQFSLVLSGDVGYNFGLATISIS